MTDVTLLSTGHLNFHHHHHHAGIGYNQPLVNFKNPLIFLLSPVLEFLLGFLIIFRRVFAMLFSAYPTFSVFYRFFPIKNNPSRFIYFGDCTNP